MNKKIAILFTLFVVSILSVSVVYAFNNQHHTVKKTTTKDNSVSKVND